MKDNKVVIHVGRGFPAKGSFLTFDKQNGKETANCWAKPNLHNNAFTLIELLVVVLIIGILAAVAVPQYQQSVEKSRATEALTNLRAIAKAQQVYRLANGQMADRLAKLDVGIIDNKFFTYTIRNSTDIIAMRKDNDIDNKKYYIYVAYTGEVICVAKTEEAKPTCQNISGKRHNVPGSGYYYYNLGINFYTK